jgi:hypothetical protein
MTAAVLDNQHQHLMSNLDQQQGKIYITGITM